MVDKRLPCTICGTQVAEDHEPECGNHPGFDLFPDEVPFPKLYAQENAGDAAIIYAKLFIPVGSAVWYITELDRGEGIAFGWADLGYGELGYISVQELTELRFGPGNRMRVERDLWFGTDHTIGEIKAGTVR